VAKRARCKVRGSRGNRFKGIRLLGPPDLRDKLTSDNRYYV
jgi:hypothetical protein